MRLYKMRFDWFIGVGFIFYFHFVIDDNGKWLGKYRIPSARHRTWDYGANGLYFITICTHQRRHYFGTVLPLPDGATEDAEPDMDYTPIGALVETNWLRIPEFHSFAVLDKFVLMPNHLHAIIGIEKQAQGEWTPNTFGPQQQNLASIIKGYKGSVTSYAIDHNIDFKWQAHFHDHIIRTDEELQRIRHYICTNRTNWAKDKDNAEGLYM